jgi:ligand-binding sensor domain-containing protein
VVTALTIDPDQSATVYAGTWMGAYKSTDAAASWDDLNAGLVPSNVVELALDPHDRSRLWAGTDAGLWWIVQALFADGFEAGNTTAWSSATP